MTVAGKAPGTCCGHFQQLDTACSHGVGAISLCQLAALTQLFGILLACVKLCRRL